VCAAIAHYAYLGAQYPVSTSIVSPRSRATTVSVMLLIVSLIGNGIGPLFTGMMSSAFMGGIVRKAGLEEAFANFNPGLCAGRIAELGETGPALCSAYAEGLRQSMVATVLFFGIAALFIGIIMWRVGDYLTKNPLTPVNHPFLKESMIHHT
jgi:ABC-type transport system involved in multi-copper enzyme maturation permease subunit